MALKTYSGPLALKIALRELKTAPRGHLYWLGPGFWGLLTPEKAEKEENQ